MVTQRPTQAGLRLVGIFLTLKLALPICLVFIGGQHKAHSAQVGGEV